MKRLILTLAAAALTTASVVAQSSNDPKKMIESIKTKIEASNKEIADVKKSASLKTWENRGKLFIEAAKVNTKGIYSGMPASKTDANPFGCLEFMNGAPTSKTTENDMEVWVYPTVKFYVQNNQVIYWSETEVACQNPLDEAAKSFRKAADLDPKGAYKDKKPTMDLIKDLRTQYYNNGINSYQLKDYKGAAHDFSEALKLTDFPRDAKDTIIQDGQIAYYAALCANEAGEKESAINYFQKAIELNYQPGSCFHYIFQINTELGKEDQAFKQLQEAYKKYPKEENILYDVINYYLGKQQYKEAEEYLNTAINEHPTNLVLYNVKSSIFVTEYGKNKEQYQKDYDNISALKKKAFQKRNNPSEKAAAEAEVADAIKTAEATKAKFAQNQKKAIECYTDALKVKADDYNSLFMLGIIAYDKSDMVLIEKNAIRIDEDKDGSIAKAKDAEMQKYWKESCEYFEKAHKADPSEKNPLTNLKMIYYKLGDTANNQRVKQILDTMN